MRVWRNGELDYCCVKNNWTKNEIFLKTFFYGSQLLELLFLIPRLLVKKKEIDEEVMLLAVKKAWGEGEAVEILIIGFYIF